MKAVAGHPTVALATAGLGVAIAVVVTLILRGSSEGRGVCRAALIPAYLPPHELGSLVNGPQRPRMVVVNPASGPGTAQGRAYGEAIRALQRAGTQVLGYVPTGYGSRPIADALADVDRYLSWYDVDGIFFDETSSDPAQLDYYRQLSRTARGAVDRVVVINPGVPPAPGYFDLADVVVTFEGAYDGYASAVDATPDWVRREPPGRVAHLVYGATRDQALGAVSGSTAGYVYATSGVMPNPWRTLPPYLQAEEEALAACR